MTELLELTPRPLHLLFSEFNARFWNGRLPRYSVRRGRLTGLHGLYDPERRTITIDPRRVPDGHERRTLLHEMCHIKAGGSHGKRFLAELSRLAAAGEAWASDERKMYADPKQMIRLNRAALREMIRDSLLAHDLPSLRAITWRTMRAYLANWYGVGQGELSTRYPWARAFFLASQRREVREREANLALRKRLRLADSM